MDSALAAISEYLQLEALGRLLLAVALAGVLGSEREIAGQAAGLRTHVLVSLGAACFTLVSHLRLHRLWHGARPGPGRRADRDRGGVSRGRSHLALRRQRARPYNGRQHLDGSGPWA